MFGSIGFAPVEGAHLKVADKVPHDHDPRRVEGQLAVELGCERPQSRQARPIYCACGSSADLLSLFSLMDFSLPGHVGEVVMLVVVAHVEADGIQGPVVRVRLV